MKTVTRIVPLVLAGLLAGCAGLDTSRIAAGMQNRVTTTIACDRAFVASLYGPLGITSEIDARDVAFLPCAARQAPAK